MHVTALKINEQKMNERKQERKKESYFLFEERRVRAGVLCVVWYQRDISLL